MHGPGVSSTPAVDRESRVGARVEAGRGVGVLLAGRIAGIIEARTGVQLRRGRASRRCRWCTGPTAALARLRSRSRTRRYVACWCSTCPQARTSRILVAGCPFAGAACSFEPAGPRRAGSRRSRDEAVGAFARRRREVARPDGARRCRDRDGHQRSERQTALEAMAARRMKHRGLQQSRFRAFRGAPFCEERRHRERRNPAEILEHLRDTRPSKRHALRKVFRARKFFPPQAAARRDR